MAKEYKITSLRLADLEKELNYLKTTREREVAAMIAEARSYGDLSENSEYDAAKNEQAKLYGRIAEIEDVLSHAVIIEDENEATGRVGLGCTVVVEDENGKRFEYKITGSLADDAAAEGGVIRQLVFHGVGFLRAGDPILDPLALLVLYHHGAAQAHTSLPCSFLAASYSEFSDKSP